MADVPGKPIANWLRTSRLGQAMPNGDPWTYSHLFDRMREDIAWAPPHPNYSKYENGKATPNRETLEKLVRFWAARGVDGPDMTPVAPPPTEQESLASAIRDLTLELRLMRESQPAAGAATAELVAVAIRETLQAAGLVVEPRPK